MLLVNRRSASIRRPLGLGLFLATSLNWVLTSCSETSMSGGSAAKKTGNVGRGNPGTGGNDPETSSTGKKEEGGGSKGDRTGAISSGDVTAEDRESVVQGRPDIVDAKTLPDGRTMLTLKGMVSATGTAVDIIFVLDSSGSMGAETTNVRTNMANFISYLGASAKGVDFKVWVLTDQAFTGTGLEASRFERYNREVGSNDALARLRDFVTAPNPPPTNALRPTARKNFVVVTDDNAEDVVATDFLTLVEGTPPLKGRTSFHGVVWTPTSVANANCTRAAQGDEYIKLANDPKTKGSILDICSTNWTELFKTLAANIAIDAAVLSYPLDKKADQAKGFEVTVGGRTLGTGQFSYDAAKNAVTIVEAQAPKKDETIVVIYTAL